MRPILLPRPIVAFIPLLLLALAVPRPASSQPPVPGTQEVPFEARQRLSLAAGDTMLPPWQRDVMLRLARGGGASALDPTASGARPARLERAVDDADGSWSDLIVQPRLAHSTIYDPVRDRMVVFGGYYSYPGYFEVDLDGVWELSLAGTPAWTRLAPTGTPPGARSFHSAIYDPVRDRMVMFGGFNNSSPPFYRDDVWALSLAGTPAWTELTPSGTPPGRRAGHSAIYDPVRDRMVVFGGYDGYSGPGGTVFNDAWELSLAGEPAWMPLIPDGASPDARLSHSAIYDPVRDRMVVFGGSTDGSTFRNDAWELSLAGVPAWAELLPTGPPPGERGYHSAVYDPVRDRMVMFGGLGDSGTGNDVWALSLAGTPGWSELTPAATPPSARYGHGAIYDPARDRMVAFGGRDSLDVPAFRNDVWALSLAGAPAWTALQPADTLPSERNLQSAIYDPVRERMMVFGGLDGVDNLFGDVWTLSLAGRPTWTLLTPSGTPPGARCGHSAIYDPVRDRMIVFGGHAETFPLVRRDVWLLSLGDTPAWSELTPGGTLPSARCYHGAIYDPVRDRMLVFGGYSGSVYRNDVWALSLAGVPEWQQLAAAGTPPIPRIAPGVIYDPVRDRMVMFGGSAGGTGLSDVWAMSLAQAPGWTQLTPAGTPPSGRGSLSAIYEPARDRMLVFGGIGDGQSYDDLWALALAGTPAWTALMPAGPTPSPRGAHSAIYDPVGARMLVFGGTTGSAYHFHDVWALSLSDSLTGVLVSLVSADATRERVRLEWVLGAGAGSSATVYRCTASTAWQALGPVSADGTDHVRYEDMAVTPGTRYGYRLGIMEGDRESFHGETWVDVPAGAAFVLSGARPNPSVGDGLWVRFALPTAEPAGLDLYDVNGRRVRSLDLGPLGAGGHELRLDRGAPLSPGVYLLRLTQGARSLTARAVVLR